jgi:arginyl-tRNA synthetase
MHTIKLNVGDSIYNHLMFLLKNLKTNELEIIEDKENTIIQEEIDFSKYKIEGFKNINDSLQWQNNIRNEWDR